MSFKTANVKNEYKKDSKLRKEDVKALQEWTKKQPHFPEITELQAILFLHSCFHSLEEAKATIDKYFTVRTQYPQYLQSISENDLGKVFSATFINILPKQTPEGNCVFLSKLLDTRSELFDCSKYIQLACMGIVLNLHQNGISNGLVVIIDSKAFGLGHLTRMNFMAVKQGTYFVQEAIPLRIKEIHFVNTDPITEKLLVFCKPFLKKEIYEKIKFHTNSFESLYETVPKKCLPEDYGGDLPSVQALSETQKKTVFENLSFFEWHDSQVVNEKQRPGRSLNLNSVYGIEGSFKTLELD